MAGTEPGRLKKQASAIQSCPCPHVTTLQLKLPGCSFYTWSGAQMRLLYSNPAEPFVIKFVRKIDFSPNIWNLGQSETVEGQFDFFRIFVNILIFEISARLLPDKGIFGALGCTKEH